jgi:hypothetical protein
MAAFVVLVVGVALAGARPGDLDSDTDSAAPVAAVTTTTSTTEPVRASQAPTSTTSTTAAAGDPAAPGSGLGATGAGAVDQQRDLATTGGETLVAPGLALLAAALVLRRRLRTTR